MCQNNQTKVTEFVLLGFFSFQDFQILPFLLFLLFFIVILSENFLIVLLISVSQNLKHPMYTFLKNLALADILSTSNAVFPLLDVILRKMGRIHVYHCIFQYYILCFSGFTQSLLLIVMSLDRYLAICHPLRYAMIMNPKNCLQLVCSSWFVAFILITSEIILMYQLEFCESNVIDHFFCDIAPILQLSTSNIALVSWYDFVLSLFMIFLAFMLVIVSYICIIVAILRMSSVIGRRKAFSTCSSHLAGVCTYYGTLVAIYLVPSSKNLRDENKFRTLMYTVVTPIMNPIIYSFKNQEITGAMKKLFMYKKEKCKTLK
ncbi:olfactory receptor 1S1-like [Hyla sarda]|uniref:olfactory receptor 1S1-like n=1 Tax=Hyla sarda TaxID=327740 RepID=UPI0024C367C5|nr:olfactory receptor 1S1-like [Hyla sarda]